MSEFPRAILGSIAWRCASFVKWDLRSRSTISACHQENRLEALKGDRTGKYSIRINDQWRIWFVWTDVGPEEVEIIDYH